MQEKEKLLEVLLFLENAPLSESQLQRYLDIDAQCFQELLVRYQETLKARNSGLVLAIRDHKISLEPDGRSLKKLSEIYDGIRKKRFSDSAIEVLGIIAFKQPCTKSAIEKIRGVDSAYLLKNLLKEGFIQIVGKQESLGTPSLYGTTQQFLYYFGLKSTDEFPNIEDFKILYR